jgi:hypothetical protein
MVEEGGCGVIGANTPNGGVFSGQEAGATDSKGGRAKGELTP